MGSLRDPAKFLFASFWDSCPPYYWLYMEILHYMETLRITNQSTLEGNIPRQVSPGTYPSLQEKTSHPAL